MLYQAVCKQVLCRCKPAAPYSRFRTKGPLFLVASFRRSRCAHLAELRLPTSCASALLSWLLPGCLVAAVARGAQRLQLPDTRPFFGVVPSMQRRVPQNVLVSRSNSGLTSNHSPSTLPWVHMSGTWQLDFKMSVIIHSHPVPLQGLVLQRSRKTTGKAWKLRKANES